MTDFSATNIHATIPSNMENTVAQLLGRTIMLRSEIRTLQDAQGRLLTALGLDPEADTIEDAIAAAEALVNLLRELP